MFVLMRHSRKFITSKYIFNIMRETDHFRLHVLRTIKISSKPEQTKMGTRCYEQFPQFMKRRSIELFVECVHASPHSVFDNFR